VILPLVIPGLTAGGLAHLTSGSGLGFGFGTGSHTATVINPITTLRGQLTRTEPVELLRVTPSDPNFYLRVTTLDHYTKNRGWTQSRLTASPRQRVDGGLPPPALGADVPKQRIRVKVETKALATSQYLPSYPNPTSIAVDGDWRYDPGSGTVFSTRTNTRDLTYTVKAVEPRQGPTLTQLMAASPPAPGGVLDKYEKTPQDARIQEIVNHVVGRSATPYAKTLAIYQYFRDPANGFIYSLATKAGSTGNDLLDFLQNKQGYCEQYASAMAIMARYAGVPARVAIGYTHGDHQHGYWSITTDDAHAWVEVYFTGIGWTTWDPTPPSENGRATTATYAPTTPATAPGSIGGGTTNPSGTHITGGGPTGQPSLSPAQKQLQLRLNRQDEVFASNDPARSHRKAARPANRHVGWWVVGAIVVVLLLAPGIARPAVSRRRRRRAADADPRQAAHAAWDDVIATAYDVGLRLDETESPRTTAARLSRQVGLDRDGRERFLRLAAAEERACYAPVVRPDGSLPELARTVRRGMLRASDASRRLRALVLPPSTVSAATHGIAARVASALDWLDGAIGRAHRAVMGRLPARTVR
jgi:transglutaminase-like putative cysteine protease